jgi:hypothetical protein
MGRTASSVLVRDPLGTVGSIPSGEIAKIDTSPVSLMPAGLTSSLQRDDLVHLLCYLTSLGVDSVRNGPKLPVPKTEIK